LLFVLPFYLETTTFPSRNMIFAPLIIAMVIIASWFSIYSRFIAKHPLRSSLFYAITSFCVLNLIFPIIFGMRNIWSLLSAGIIAAAAVAIFIYPHIDIIKNRRNRVIFLLGIGIFFILLWIGRSLIPPAPLKLTRTEACRGIENFRPFESFRRAKASETEIVFFYSSIFAPRGLSEKIHHYWSHNGKRLFSVSLTKIHGGRKEGFGTWSQHTIKEGPGTYAVEVWTDGGQLLGSGEFNLY
ncbi:MAG: DUF2914 domain-containing protein, partial [Chrysiogenales bacterium]